VEFRILGPLEVVDERGPVRLPATKQRALLAILLLHRNEVVSADRLIDELWGERPPKTARKTLQMHVSHLRRVLPAGGATTACSAPGVPGSVRCSLSPSSFRPARGSAWATWSSSRVR
jgi:DNA-binding SARP family transcriptional activator